MADEQATNEQLLEQLEQARRRLRELDERERRIDEKLKAAIGKDEDGTGEDAGED